MQLAVFVRCICHAGLMLPHLWSIRFVVSDMSCLSMCGCRGVAVVAACVIAHVFVYVVHFIAVVLMCIAHCIADSIVVSTQRTCPVYVTFQCPLHCCKTMSHIMRPLIVHILLHCPSQSIAMHIVSSVQPCAKFNALLQWPSICTHVYC